MVQCASSHKRLSYSGGSGSHSIVVTGGKCGHAIISCMDRRSGSVIKTGGGVDLAFAVVVLASYFATFSSVKEASTLQLVMMISLGMAYLTVGIYGYGLCVRLEWLPLDLAYFFVQVLLGGAIVYLGKGAGFNAMVLLPLAGQAVVLLSPRWAYLVNAIVFAAYLAAVYLYSGSLAALTSGLPIFVAGQIFIVVFTQMAVSEEKARSEVERLVGELTEANHRLREYVAQVEELSIAKERNRLAREIHDGLGHYLTTVFMQIQAGRAVMKTDAKRGEELLEKAQNLTQEALVDVRKSVGSLRLDPFEGQPLPERINRLLHTMDLNGVNANFLVKGNERELSPQVVLTIFRAAQEGITNTCKHSKAKNLWVELDYRDPELIKLKVRDDGVGAESTTGGFGLIGLRERANLLNGSFDIQTQNGQGFCFEMVVPG